MKSYNNERNQHQWLQQSHTFSSWNALHNVLLNIGHSGGQQSIRERGAITSAKQLHYVAPLLLCCPRGLSCPSLNEPIDEQRASGKQESRQQKPFQSLTIHKSGPRHLQPYFLAKSTHLKNVQYEQWSTCKICFGPRVDIFWTQNWSGAVYLQE